MQILNNLLSIQEIRGTLNLQVVVLVTAVMGDHLKILWRLRK